MNFCNFIKLHLLIAFCSTMFVFASCELEHKYSSNQTHENSFILSLKQDFFTFDNFFCSEKNAKCIVDRNKTFDRIYQSFKNGSTNFGLKAREVVNSLPEDTFNEIWLRQEGIYTEPGKLPSEKRVFEKRNVLILNLEGKFIKFLQKKAETEGGYFLKEYLKSINKSKTLSPILIVEIMQHYKKNYPQNDAQSAVLLINLLTIEYNHNLGDMKK